jgi:hypothetical protein
MQNLLHIVAGSFILSVVHASIPNHWIPLVLISRAERWSKIETLSLTFIVSSLHVLSTVLIGIAIGMIGYRVSTAYGFVMGLVAPLVLILLGLFYLLLDFRRSHSHIDAEVLISKRSKPAIVFSLGVAMFFSPCIEIEAYYLTAGKLGWSGIAAISIVYFFVTVVGMLLFVYLGIRGIERIKWRVIEEHEKGVVGAVLIILGAFVLLTQM